MICKNCGKLIRTAFLSEVNKLVSSSFLYVQKCNDCLVKSDIILERKGLKKGKSSRTLKEFNKEILPKLLKKYPNLKK